MPSPAPLSLKSNCQLHPSFLRSPPLIITSRKVLKGRERWVHPACVVFKTIFTLLHHLEKDFKGLPLKKSRTRWIGTCSFAHAQKVKHCPSVSRRWTWAAPTGLACLAAFFHPALDLQVYLAFSDVYGVKL